MRFFVKSKIFVLFLFLFPRIEKSYELLPTEDDYISFIINVCKFYKTKSAIFLYANSTREIEMTTIIYKWTIAFSREGFYTSNFYFFELHESFYYINKIVKPLYIAVISDDASIDEFSLATDTFDMSFATWLVVFIYNGNNANYCLKPPGNIFHLRYDTKMLVRCYMENILREWYSIDRNRTEINDLAIWNSDKKINKTIPGSLYQRRFNLHGLVMKAVIVKEAPFSYLQENGKLGGIFGRILTELCKTLNFSFVIESEVGEYGVWKRKENIWTGAVGVMYNGSANISISDFSMSSARMNIVDFTLPLIISTNCLYFKKPEIFAVEWSSFFLTFTSSVWISIFGVLTAASILLIYIKIKNGINRKFGYLISDNFIEICGIFCQQGMANFPNRSSLRITYFSMLLMAYVLSAAYSAALISFLTSVHNFLPFHTLEGFVKDGTYKFSVIRGSAIHDLFANSKDTIAKKCMDKMIEEEKLPKSAIEGFNKICKDTKLAFYVSEETKKTINLKIPCNVASIQAGLTDNLAIILSKHNQFTGVINFHLQQFLNNGMMNRLKDNTFKKKSNDLTVKHKSVPITNVLSIILFIQIGIILSTFILIIEKYIFSHKNEKKSMRDRIPRIKSSKFYEKRKKNIKNISKSYANRKRTRLVY